MQGYNLANSSTVNKRKESDFYPTPPDVTQALINTGVIPRGTIWEPACGDGHMADVFLANGYGVVATDIRDTDYSTYQADFLIDVPPFGDGEHIPSIVTNPPFNVSAAFIQRCIDIKVGVFALLLKSQYWHSKTGAYCLKNTHQPM